MLSGQITYRYGGRSFRYDVDAMDTSETFTMYMTSGNYDALLLMCNPMLQDDPHCMNERSIEIKLTKVNVETQKVRRVVDGKEKSFKCDVNADLFCRLGALIRFVKTNCNIRTEDGYTGLQLASGEFEARIEKAYTVPFPIGAGRPLAHATLRYSDLTSLHVETDDFTIDLDPGVDDFERVFYHPKDAWTSGIKLNEEYLGFPVKPPVSIENVPVDGIYLTIEDIMAAHPEKELAWLLDKDYRIVTDETLQETCDYIMAHNGYVYYDTETTGLNINFLSRTGQADQCVGIILSVKYGESFFFPLQMKHIDNLCGGDHFFVMERYLRQILEGKELVAHNLPFDWKVSYIYGINANIVHDTLAILELTLAEEIKDYKVGLKENAKLLLGRDSLELSDLIVDDRWGENDIKFWDLPAEAVRLYACADTDNTNGLLGYAMQNNLLGKYGATKVYQIEIAFSFAVAYQEFYGHRIDINNLDAIREEIGKGQAEEMRKMVEICGHEFNPNSPKQLVRILYEELGIPAQYSRKTGNMSTDKMTLQKLGELTDAEDNIMYPFVGHLLKFREYEGVRKIIDKFPEHVTSDGYVFSKVMQYGTTTGRVSINSPNYQSYNDPIKKNVIPRPGFWMFDTDYSSVEYRVLGNMVGNKAIMESFKDPDFDYHTYQAAHMYGVPYAAVSKKLRKAAKGINFGLPYGMGDESLGLRVFGEATPENTRKAAALRAAYFKGQEDIRDWFEFNRDKGVNMGYTETYFGRRRYYRRSDFSVNAIRRQAGNQVIQGCLHGDTRIQTKEFGIVRISQVVGLNLHVWDGEGWTKGYVAYSGKKRLCRVHFAGGQYIECSPTHKFAVVSNKRKSRWVECKDLVGSQDKANYHRVMINRNFVDSDWRFESDKGATTYGVAHNANNVCLEDIGDSTDIGLFLGRLASDGNYPMSDDTGRHDVSLVVAEHEYDILDVLRRCVTRLGYTEDSKMRPNRTQELTYLTVGSSSLCSELRNMDVRHSIDDSVFADTVALRQYLRGFTDGDGGISGRTVTIVWGDHYDFEPMIRDFQKALLFFGIRSHYRHYPGDRYVLQIRVHDNERFMKEIGFISQSKNEAGYELHSVENEHVYGHVLGVEYVEMLDEEVDMYDVCNTERGYYVADGIIVHNSAADIYKTAVGRVFKRLCKEGLLGRVILTGFIHDELLGEVANDINPAIWLKILREEFEVKITNGDGSPWCPLYMGFGYGMSWYEAKSVELPIRLQWEIVEKYGDTGFDNWDGNGRKFFDGVPDMLREFEVRDARNQLLDTDSQGKEIKPALNSKVIDLVKEDSGLYPKAIQEYASTKGVVEVTSAFLSAESEELCAYLDKNYHIQGLFLDESGVPVADFKPSKVTQEVITQYCMLHATDRSAINLLDMEEYTGEGTVSEAQYIIGEDDDDYEPTSEEKLQKIKDTRIDTLGMYVDTDKMEIFLMALPPEYMAFLQKKVNHENKGYRVWFKDSRGLMDVSKPGALYLTNSWLDSTEINTVQELYLQYFKSN